MGQWPTEKNNKRWHFCFVHVHRSETDRYEVLVSARLGRSTSKEQYAYIYK